MFEDVPAAAITRFHDERLSESGWPSNASARNADGVWRQIELNHRFNTLLWNEEDLARRRHVPDGDIAANKRAIDDFNQKRNDAIEKIDEALLTRLAAVKIRGDARLNSETAGSMIDRLSILSLKIHHMGLQTRRTDVGRDHIETCEAKLARLREQRIDLSTCLDGLLCDAAAGAARFKVYRQFKMYNDPKLNPQIYRETGKGA